MARIIVPTDFSSTSVSALQYANYLAIVTGYDLAVIHVHDGYGNTDALIEKRGNLAARTEAMHKVEEFIRFNLSPSYFSERVPGIGQVPALEISEMVGAPAASILKASEENDTALIVMGGTGSGGTSTVSPLFGSVAQTVALGATCPVFLIPCDYGIPEINEMSVAFEYVQPLKEMIEKINFLRKPLDANVRLVHVKDADADREESKEVELMEEILKTGFPGFPVELDLLAPGDVAKELLQYATGRNVDLLVMGRRQRGFFSSLFIGSEAGPVIKSCTTPLMIIPIKTY
ncbi:universal stress protein [Neolewinella agarilytica]|uniref:Nucleotide-binding universal stress protein, UspA family n=1 Tax=Neolewinella agarilytica TaxID=478744 RepID=A0A1H9EPK8_9BACT|nr:universal stress protein [Neolewinella agarilytica]SEQ26928.1 Nucleotide-binding universal stress protein, UspA family [Neolewinella agarilytica]